MARGTVTQEHKDAMARGRRLSRTVDAYLRALEAPRQRGPRLSEDEVRSRLEEARSQVDSATGLEKLKAAQAVVDLEKRLADLGTEESLDFEKLETDFIEVASEYGDAHGISYPAWRSVGVPAATLKAAGVRRTRR